MYENELQHHGVKGMKWGVRKATKTNQATDLAQKKTALVKAKKAYNKSYRKADTLRLQAFSLSKKRRQANSDRWDDVFRKAEELATAKAEYKKARLNKNSSVTEISKSQQASRGKKAVKGALIAAGAAHATYTVAATAAMAYSTHRIIKELQK